jgi:hypothetical protein
MTSPSRLESTRVIAAPAADVFAVLTDPQGHATRVTSYYDWSHAREEWRAVFPVISEDALRSTLGILERTVRRGYVRG